MIDAQYVCPPLARPAWLYVTQKMSSTSVWTPPLVRDADPHAHCVLVRSVLLSSLHSLLPAPCVGAAFSSELLPVMVRDRASGEEVSKEVKLNIWDTAGEEMYRSMTKSFFRNANAGE